MATSLTVGTMKGTVSWSYLDGNTAISQTTNAGSLTHSDTLAAGTGADQGDTIYWTSGTLAASGTSTIDLSSLTDIYGNSISFARVKCMLIKNTTTGSNLTEILAVGGAAMNAFAAWLGDATDVVDIRPNGALMLVCADATAYAVSTNVNLLLTNEDGSNSLTYELVIIGASA